MYQIILFIGLYSRGKSHLLRLSVPIQLLLSLWNDQERNGDHIPETTDQTNDLDDDINNDVAQHIDTTDQSADSDSDINNDAEQDINGTEETDDDDSEHIIHRQRITSVGPTAVNIAHSIVDTCLSQLCEFSQLVFLY